MLWASSIQYLHRIWVTYAGFCLGNHLQEKSRAESQKRPYLSFHQKYQKPNQIYFKSKINEANFFFESSFSERHKTCDVCVSVFEKKFCFWVIDICFAAASKQSSRWTRKEVVNSNKLH